MASATGIPESHPPVHEAQEGRLGEDAPLLGRTGDASQQEGTPLYQNLLLGTAILSQVGIVLFIILIWVTILTATPFQLFSAHPLLNSLAILLLTQSTLLLQPTHTAGQKRRGTHVHAALNLAALAALVAGSIVIFLNKLAHHGAHLESPHAILGSIAFVWLLLQVLVGIVQYFVPRVFGGVERAKRVYKYHRVSGYLLLVLLFVTVGAATFTTFNVATLHLRLWAVVVTSLLVVVGMVPRIRLSKFGL